MHGGAGVTDDFPLGEMFAAIRTLRIADGPDEVHRALVAKLELRKYTARGMASAEATSCIPGLEKREPWATRDATPFSE
jgi:hypothetical protein